LFTINRNDNLFRLSNNSQVCYLEHVLNYKYDQKEHKIRIDDYSAYGTLSYIYWEVNGDGKKDTSNDHMKIYKEPTAASTADDITAYTDNTPILCSEVALATGVTTFNVMIARTGGDINNVYDYVNNPTLYSSNTLIYRKFCAIINTYKLAGKKYKIIPYTPKT
ncbi:MAG: hypothetical protein P4L28_12210, partial [Paludibacteraceae bacterium]|nr:hypothetical protein [Paludibacteraceae bacterium]